MAKNVLGEGQIQLPPTSRIYLVNWIYKKKQTPPFFKTELKLKLSQWTDQNDSNTVVRTEKAKTEKKDYFYYEKGPKDIFSKRNSHKSAE